MITRRLQIYLLKRRDVYLWQQRHQPTLNTQRTSTTPATPTSSTPPFSSHSPIVWFVRPPPRLVTNKEDIPHLTKEHIKSQLIHIKLAHKAGKDGCKWMMNVDGRVRNYLGDVSSFWLRDMYVHVLGRNEERNQLMHELAHSVMSEVNIRGRAATAEGEAWLARAEAGSLREKLKQVVDWLMSQIDSREEVLKQIHQFVQEVKYERERRQRKYVPSVTSPTTATTTTQSIITIHHPDDYSPSLFTQIDTFLTSRASYHHRWIYINIALLPVSALAAVLPGPNVFFAWNAFRLYGHYQARLGALELQRSILEDVEGTDEPTKRTRHIDVTQTDEAIDIPIEYSSYDTDHDRSFHTMMLELDQAALQKHIQGWKMDE